MTSGPKVGFLSFFAVKRIACLISPDTISSYRTKPGRIGKPAASAEVQFAERRRLDFKSKTAPDTAVQDFSFFLAEYSSYNLHVFCSNTRTCLSPSLVSPPSIGALCGIGYGPGSLSFEYSKDMGTGEVSETTINGIPIGCPSQSPEPKSAFNFFESRYYERKPRKEDVPEGYRSECSRYYLPEIFRSSRVRDLNARDVRIGSKERTLRMK